MTLCEFLTSPTAALPKVWCGGDLIEYYQNITDEYFSSLSTIRCEGYVDKEVVDKVSLSIEIRDCVQEALSYYLAGYPSSAYEKLSEVITNNQTLFSSVVSEPVEQDYLKNLYRIRKLDGNTLAKEDMFHIPFELRHKVSTQRYSIPGFPSLYLSSSLYTAWKELLTPNLNDIVAVRVELTDKVKVLDFGHPPQFMGSLLEPYNRSLQSGKLFNLVTAKLIIWPLLAACSIIVYNKSAPFKPEYIIPQLVLQLVRNDVFGNEIQGIRYYSMNFGQDNFSIKLGSNYVFPVKTSQSKGHCPELIEKLYLSEPMLWQVANIVTDEVDLSQVPEAGLEISPGYSVPYRSTKFAHVEAMLIAQPATKL